MKNWLKLLLLYFADDILFIIGLFFILTTTYKINLFAGLYATGCVFILAGALLAKNKARDPTKGS